MSGVKATILGILNVAIAVSKSIRFIPKLVTGILDKLIAVCEDFKDVIENKL